MIPTGSLRAATSEWYGRRDLPPELNCPHTGFSGPHKLEILPDRGLYAAQIVCWQCRQQITLTYDFLAAAGDITTMAEYLDRCVMAMGEPFWNQDWGSLDPDESEAW